MMSTHILGIDVGIDGALALLDSLGHLTVHDVPTLETIRNAKAKRSVDIAALRQLVIDLAPTHAVIERVGAMPKQGTSSMFSFGRTVGVIEGVLGALQVPISYVAPQVWQKAMSVPPGKDGSRLRASELMPGYSERWRRKRDHGRSDAALIALWGLTHVTTIITAQAVVAEAQP
jgi:hypothetical protein